ncbi:S9 family peptidase [Flavobacterium sp. 2]|uniref:S9 family peptidase n=1 Tax=Flavobacterium sp. 2 TaxID=308053 RepID=UPI003CF12839
MKAINYIYKCKDCLPKILRTVLILLYIFPNLFNAQVSAKPLPPSDYHLWNETLIRNVSPDGNWVSYLLMYESKKDTLFVKALESDKLYSFPRSRQGYFLNNSFICQRADTLIIQNLKDGTLKLFSGIAKFKISADNKYIALIKKIENSSYGMLIKDTEGKAIYEENNVKDFQLSDTGHQIIYTSLSKTILTIKLKNINKTDIPIKIMETSAGTLPKFSWKNNTVAIISRKKDKVFLYSYNIKKQLLKECPFGSSLPASLNMKISYDAYSSILVSNNGSKIFFRISEPIQKESVDGDIVEIWNSADKRLFDRKKRHGSYNSISKVAVWNVNNNIIRQITNRQNPELFLSGSLSHAFLYDSSVYEPQTEMNSPIDLFAMDLTSGEKWVIEQKLSGDYLPQPSPNGRYLAYFKDRQLWCYNIDKKKPLPLLENNSLQFFNQNRDMPGNASPWGIAGWSSCSRYLLVYDEFDLWQIDVSTMVLTRLTQGREEKKVFRISTPLYETTPPYHEFSNSPSLRLEHELLFSVKDHNRGMSGFYSWDRRNGTREILWTEKRINQIVKTSLGEYIYLGQRFDSPPAIMQTDGKKNEKLIMQSNPQHKKYLWGKASLVKYNFEGKQLSGILYTPPEFNKGKKSPMIVYIYEKQSQQLHIYQNPSLHTSDGFNLPHLLSKGYFILLPDIAYEFGRLNKSVTGSVLAAIDTVLAEGNVDNSKIGLIGHSFGGYEVDLIITQTDRFATAVAGAGWTDLISSYLYMGPTLSRPDFYRCEFDQLRIGKSLFENKNAYLENSPVLLSENVSTPLLAWTGKEDRHVNALQTQEFYFALRRLNKEHVMLIYPTEGHNLRNNTSQEDLTLRIQQWFDHFLKGSIKEEWMSPKID